MPIRTRIIRNKSELIVASKGAATLTDELNRYTRIRLAKLWRDAVRAWIEAVVKEWVRRGAVDTGMSLASLLPLARTSVQPFATTLNIRAVGIVKSGLTSKKRGPRRDAYIPYTRGMSRSNVPSPVKGKFKSMAQGERDGKDQFVVSVGPPSAPKLVFEFNISVAQYALNEGESIITFIRGNDAFREYIRNNYKRYLDVADYKRIIMGKGVPPNA